MKYWIALIALALAASSAFSQEYAGAKAVMLDYIKTVKAWDTERMAEYMHPEALSRVRMVFDEALQGDRQSLARAHLFPVLSVSTYREFSELSGAQVFRRVYEQATASTPGLRELMSRTEYEILGQEVTGNEVVLTYEITLKSQDKEVVQKVEQRLKQHEGEWLLLLPPDSEATIGSIKARY